MIEFNAASRLHRRRQSDLSQLILEATRQLYQRAVLVSGHRVLDRFTLRLQYVSCCKSRRAPIHVELEVNGDELRFEHRLGDGSKYFKHCAARLPAHDGQER